MTLRSSPVLVEVTRGDVVEGLHHGRLVVTAPDGSVLASLGNPDAPFYARSSLKPLQALAMLRSGLDVAGDDLAIVCASHTGEPVHLEAVRHVLAGAGLDESALQNTPDLPGDSNALAAWLTAGRDPASITQNCSGKHAGMVRTCVRAGWPLETYLDSQHPLQQAVAATIAEQTGDASHGTVDGCGAPLFATPMAGLAAAFGRLASASDGSHHQLIADAMRGRPDLVSGTGRPDLQLMSAVRGVVSKGGAEGVWAVGLSSGHGIVAKADDGSHRGVQVVVYEVLRLLGHTSRSLGHLASQPVLGHGAPVGEVRVSEPVQRQLAEVLG